MGLFSFFFLLLPVKKKKEVQDEEEKRERETEIGSHLKALTLAHKSFIFENPNMEGPGIFMASANSKTPGDCFENAHSPASIKQPDAHNFSCQPNSLFCFFVFSFFLTPCGLSREKEGEKKMDAWNACVQIAQVILVACTVS